MKTPLIIGVSALTLLASATLLFAQTTTGTSLITEMKAAVRSFTLAGQLNPGITGLQSAPVSGKVTGDILTAGEWNRMLELAAQGGGGTGGFTTTIFRDVTNGYTGAASIKTYTCPGGQYVLSVSSVMIPSGQYSCANTPNVDKKSVSYNSCEPLAGQTWQTDIICGGGGGAGAGGGGLKLCAGNDVSCQTNGIIGMKCEVLPLLNQGKFENPNQWHYSGVAMKVENGRWYGSFPEYQNAGHFANVACDRVLVYDPSLSGSGGGQSNIIKGTATVGFTNGQPHSSMATVSFGSTCTNPVITVQSVNDSIACGTGAGSGICSNSPGTTSEDLKAYFSGVTATDFKVYLSSMSGVWVGASSPAFGINYIVACD